MSYIDMIMQYDGQREEIRTYEGQDYRDEKKSESVRGFPHRGSGRNDVNPEMGLSQTQHNDPFSLRFDHK
jgi:hypothetical protein